MAFTPEEDELHSALTSHHRAVEGRVLREIADAATSSRPRPRLRGLLADVNRWMASLVDGTRRWLSTALPRAYGGGATQAAATMGLRFDWTTPHRDAVEALARQAWDDVAGTLQGVGADTKRAIRSLLDDAVRSQIVEGVPGPRASAELARAIQSETGAMTVRYSNGARHSVSDWADSVARTTTATTRNAGVFARSREAGVTYAECADGSDCALGPGHNSGPLANGLVLPLDEAEGLTLSHPRCARSWSPRPDVRTPDEADEARRFTPEEQEAMAAEERARAARQNVGGRPRGTLAAPRAEGRQPRTGRAGRAPRATRV